MDTIGTKVLGVLFSGVVYEVGTQSGLPGVFISGVSFNQGFHCTPYLNACMGVLALQSSPCNIKSP